MHYKEVKISIMSDMHVFHQVIPNLVIITKKTRGLLCTGKTREGTTMVIVNTIKTSGIYVISIE